MKISTSKLTAIGALTLFTAPLLAVTQLNQNKVMADEQPVQSSFSVQAKIGIPQQNPEVSNYFDLTLPKSEDKTIEIDYNNPTDKSITVATEISNATTNDALVVQYIETGKKPDPSLKYNLKDMVSFEPMVTIKPHSTHREEFHIKALNDDYNGVIAGGITIRDVDSGKTSTQGGTTTTTNSQYDISLLIRQNANKVKSDLKLVDSNADGDTTSLKLQNPTNDYIKGVVVTGAFSIDKGQIAPNSNFTLSGKAFSNTLTVYGNPDPKGEYTYNGKTYLNRWEFKLPNNSKVLNVQGETLITSATKHFSFWWLIILILLLIIAWLIYKNKQKDKEKDTPDTK